jgi:ParB/RepB/Spo0J family partition protein
MTNPHTEDPMSSKETIEQSPAVDAVETPAEAPAQFALLARALIVRSKTNPRTRFNPTYIEELRDSIRQHKIAQPLLVRPLPAARLQETHENRMPGDPLPTHELVCGECRWRAAEGVQEILPVMIRELTDIQVLQIQLVENLQREGLHPLEEAEGYERLVSDHGFTVEEVAAKVKKSPSYVYKAMKLLDLTPACREQLYAGDLSQSVALLVARAPAYLQAKIAKDVMKGEYDQLQEPMTYRDAVRHIQQHYMLQLGAAVFDIKDASLVTKAGSCTDCTKRTGANRQLFGDIDHADTCTDPKCFDKKKEAHHTAVAAKAKAAGKTVIQGKEAQEIFEHQWSEPKGYKLLDKKEYIDGRTVSVRGAIGKENLAGVKTVLIVNPHTKETVEAIKADLAGTLLAKAAKRKAAETQVKETSKEPTEFELRQRLAEARNTRILKATHAAMAGEGFANVGHAVRVKMLRELGAFIVDWTAVSDTLAELLQSGKVAAKHGMGQYFEKCADDDVAPALMLLMLDSELDEGGATRGPVQTELCKALGVDVKAIEQDVQADMKAEAAQRKANAQANDKPAAKKAAVKAAAKKPKTTAAEAKAGIAKALQGNG